MTTILEAMNRVRRRVYGSNRIDLNTLATAIDNLITTVTVVFTYASNTMAPGSVINIGTELMYVWVWDKSAKTATVQRAWLSSTIASHAVGDEIEINPRFPSTEIFTSIIEEINGWPTTLYAIVAATTATPTQIPGAINLPTTLDGCYGIIEIRRAPDTTAAPGATTWPRIVQAELVRSMDTANFTLGNMLQILEGGLGSGSSWSSNTLRIIAAMPFTTSSATTASDLQTTVGLQPSMTDLVVYGASIRMLGMQEIKRSARDSQDDPRLGAEVPPGISIQATFALQRLYDRRLTDEANKLNSRYPIRFN